MEEKKNKVERMRALRLSIGLKFKYQVLGKTEEAAFFHEGATKNISSSGLLFESKAEYAIDTALKIIIDMPGLPPKALELEGRVVRIEKLFRPPMFNIGVSFINLSQIESDELKSRIDRMDIIALLSSVDKKEISDLHLTSGTPPMVRHYGELKPLNGQPLSAEEIKQMIYSILTAEQKEHFEADKDLDFSFVPGPNLRYRVSIYKQRGATEVVFRHIMASIKSREELALPDIVEDFCKLKDGLVIIGGTTGAGKTTSIAYMIDAINKQRGGVILSLEKPIEYMHKNIKGIVKQREVGVDVASFASGLKAALRQDPDIIVVGEILDPDTIETALEAAETGHLVISSLHATDTVQVFDRVVSFFPLEQREFIYLRLSHSLKGVIIQTLLPHRSGTGRILATEVCVANPAVRRIIRSGDFVQLPSLMQMGSQHKMHLMQQSIDKLFEYGLIASETYEAYSKK